VTSAPTDAMSSAPWTPLFDLSRRASRGAVSEIDQGGPGIT